jgi:hypothetical protein
MSLINEALKRASTTRQGRGDDPSDGIAMRHAQPAPSRKLPIPVQAIVLAAVLLVGFFVWKGWQRGAKVPPVAASVEQAALPVAQKTAPIEIMEAALPAADPEPVPVAARPADTEPVAMDDPSVEPALTAPGPAPAAGELVHRPLAEDFPPLRLQGIFYRPSDPIVLINGRILAVGDVFEGIRLDKIEAQSVTVEWHGHVRTVRLGQ